MGIRTDIYGVEVKIGDIVHCWSGSKTQSEITQSLRGVVNEDADGNILVGDNELAMGCAEFVEIIESI